MAVPTQPTDKLLDQSSIVIDAQSPIDRTPLLQVVCDAYIEFGRLAVIATLLGLTSFIVTYVIKNQSLTEAIAAEPLPIELRKAL
jgi:hypothetical protein